MIISKLSKLENRIKSGEWKPKNTNELWGGADVIVAYKRTKELNNWVKDDRIIIDGKEQTNKSRILVVSKHADKISALIYELKDLFKSHIDFVNKYTFYKRIGGVAKSYTEKKDDIGVLFEIIEESKKMATEINNIFYFAYGSNMDIGQMEERCPIAILIGKRRLDGYKFIINSRGVASIIKKENSFVEGVLWKISKKDVASLNNYEGVNLGLYIKEEITVSDYARRENQRALVYIASDNSKGYPRSDYLEKIILAAEKFKFDLEYLKELKRWNN